MTTNPTLFLSKTGFREVAAATLAPGAIPPGTITNAMLVNDEITVNGVTIDLGGSGTITATASSISGLIDAGLNIDVTGAGTIASPYVVSTVDVVASNTLGGATIVTNVVTITRANYNALSPPDAQTLYFING